MDHLFFTCPYSQAVWRGSQTHVGFQMSPSNTFDINFKAVLDCSTNRNLPQLTRHLPIWILWRTWKSRNLLVYQKQQSHWQTDLQKAITDAKEWIPTFQGTYPRQNSDSIRQQRLKRWEKPREGYVKCNYDCRFNQASTPSLAAWIIRDAQGYYKEAAQAQGQICDSPLEAELQALLLAMQSSWIKGYKYVIFEGDNHTVSKLVNGESKNFKYHNWIRDIKYWRNKFISVSFQWVSREANKVADRLVKHPLYGNHLYISHFYIPHCITQLLHEDYSLAS